MNPSNLRALVPSCEPEAVAQADQDIITIRKACCPICGCLPSSTEETGSCIRYHHDDDDGRVCLARANHTLLGPSQAVKLLAEGSQPEIAAAAFHSLITKVCPACGAYKKPKQSFCLGCYRALSRSEQRGLYSREKYVANWFDALRRLDPAAHLHH